MSQSQMIQRILKGDKKSLAKAMTLVCSHLEQDKKKAQELLKNLNVKNVFFKHSDGGLGWSEQAPFDRIMVTASAPEIPNNLLNQLSDDGIMIIPIGEEHSNQVLKKIVKDGKKYSSQNIMEVRFVPLLEGKISN